MTTIVFNADLEALATKISFSVGETDVYISNGSTAKLTRNFASGAAEGTVIGAPVISAASTRFTGNSNYVDTQIDDSTNITMIAIAKRPTGWSGDAMALSNNGQGGVNIGCSLWYLANGNIGFSAARDNGSGSQTSAIVSTTPADPLAWALVIGEAGTANRFTNMTTNQTVLGTNTNARFVSPAKMRIGSSYQVSHTGQIDVMVCVVIPRVLTTLERDSVVAQLRAYATKYGVTV